MLGLIVSEIEEGSVHVSWGFGMWHGWDDMGWEWECDCYLAKLPPVRLPGHPPLASRRLLAPPYALRRGRAS